MNIKYLNFFFLFLYFSLFLFSSSCTRLGSLNLKTHHFGTVPIRIVWLQVPGLSEEHLALLHFSPEQNSEQKLSLFESRCIGKMWNYNLYQLRPGPFASFLTQMTGSKNIKSKCEDYDHRPVWSYLSESGFVTGMLEYNVDEVDSFETVRSCPQGRNFLKDLTLWRMAKAKEKNAEFFHHQEKKNYKSGMTYFDLSCQKDVCSDDLLRNVKSLFEQFVKLNNEYLFIVKDFSYFHHLKAQDISAARESLLQIEKVFDYFQKMSNEDTRFLVVLTTAGVVNFEFPNNVDNWLSFEKTGKPTFFRSDSLMGSVFAVGAKAENFCGLFEEVEFFPRLFQKSGKRTIFGGP